MRNRNQMLHQPGQGNPYNVPSALQSQNHQFDQHHGNSARNQNSHFLPYDQNSYNQQGIAHYESLAARSSIPNHVLPRHTLYGFNTNASASNFYNGHLMVPSSSSNGFFRERNLTRAPLETLNWGGLQYPNASSVSHYQYQHAQPLPPPHLQAMRGNQQPQPLLSPPPLPPHLQAMRGNQQPQLLPPPPPPPHMQAVRGNQRPESMHPQLQPQPYHMQVMGGNPLSQNMPSSHVQAMRGNHQPQNLLPPAMRGNNFNHQPQVTSSSYRHSVNNRTENFGPSTAFDLLMNVMYQLALECLGVEDNSQYHLRNTIQEEGVAVLEQLALDDADLDLRNLQDGVYILDPSSDFPNPSMSYEFLLSLADQIGHVRTGLSEKTITENLKIRTCILSGHQEEEPEICVICQAEFEDSETIGSLHCGHEYHADCIKKWLLEKNICPVCKATAMTRES